jgi:hypothetical protein
MGAIMILKKVNFGENAHFLKSFSLWASSRLFVGCLKKGNILSQNPLGFGKKFVAINCIQYERVFKICYFHILNVAKFG